MAMPPTAIPLNIDLSMCMSYSDRAIFIVETTSLGASLIKSAAWAIFHEPSVTCERSGTQDLLSFSGGLGCSPRFHFRASLWNRRPQHAGALRRDQHVVLDANAAEARMTLEHRVVDEGRLPALRLPSL